MVRVQLRRYVVRDNPTSQALRRRDSTGVRYYSPAG